VRRKAIHMNPARMRTWLMFDILPVLAPKASAPEKHPERITAEALLELVQRNAVCVHDQEHRCPLMLFTQAMAWELNCYFGVGDEVDRAYRRSGDPAARPLGPGHGEEE